MEHADLLQTIAQISIAFAGFAGVVAAFSKFRLDPEAAIFRIRLMVVVALVTLLFSLFPLLPPNFGLSESDSWRISAFLFSLTIISISIWSWVRLRFLYQAGLLNTQKITIVWYLAAVILIIALFVTISGRIDSFTPAIYITALFFGLALCSFYFIMLIVAVELEKG